MSDLILTKPQSDDTYDIAVFNYNSGLIEDAVNGINTDLGNIISNLTDNKGDLVDIKTIITQMNTLVDETVQLRKYPGYADYFNIDGDYNGISLVSNMEVEGTFPDDITETKKTFMLFSNSIHSNNLQLLFINDKNNQNLLIYSRIYANKKWQAWSLLNGKEDTSNLFTLTKLKDAALDLKRETIPLGIYICDRTLIRNEALPDDWVFEGDSNSTSQFQLINYGYKEKESETGPEGVSNPVRTQILINNLSNNIYMRTTYRDSNDSISKFSPWIPLNYVKPADEIYTTFKVVDLVE